MTQNAKRRGVKEPMYGTGVDGARKTKAQGRTDVCGASRNESMEGGRDGRENKVWSYRIMGEWSEKVIRKMGQAIHSHFLKAHEVQVPHHHS